MSRPELQLMQHERFGAEDVDILQPFVEKYPFNPYRNYRIFNRRAQTSVMTAELATILPVAGINLAQTNEAQTLVVSRPLSWDSSFFGLPMARIDYIFGDRGPTAAAALDACLDALRSSGMRHVSVRVDVADIEAAMLLEQRGFRLLGGTLTYTARPKRERPRRVRVLGRVRPFQKQDAEPILAIAEQAFQDFRGRFHVDPGLPRHRVNSFYGEWARRCVTHEMADTILVSEASDGRLLGFVAFQRREPISTISGVPVFGSGLAACRPDSPGAYPGLLHHTVAFIHDRNGVAEARTQNHNAAAIAIHEAVGLRSRGSHLDFSLSLA
jgi:hypothetical protein